MRRLLQRVGLWCLLATAAYAQMRGGFGHGFVGGGGFRGPAFRSGSMGFPRSNFGFGHRGFDGSRGRFFFPHNRFFFHRQFFSPFTFPIFWDSGYYGNSGYFGDYPYYSYPPQPNVIVIYPHQSPSAPQVVMEESTPPATTPPETRQKTPAPDPDPPAPIFSLAFRGHSVSRAVAYWVVGKTLHFVTTQGQRYAVLLNQVDRPLSMKLNQERGVAFGLPG